MDGASGQPHQDLVGTVMAALSKRSRRSVHPADHRLLVEQAMRVAVAVETAFLLAERPAEPVRPAQGREEHLVRNYD